MAKQISSQQYQEVYVTLKDLEKRLSAIESRLNIQSSSSPVLMPSEAVKGSEESDIMLEHKISANWFAKAGVIIISIGFAFLLTFNYQNLPEFSPIIFGLFIVGSMYALAHYWRNSNPHFSRLLVGGSIALLFFTTLRLQFLSVTPIIESELLEILLLVAVVITGNAVAIRLQSIYLAGLGLFLGFITVLITKDPLFTFSGLTILAIATVFLSLRYHWRGLVYWSIVWTYISHFVWFLGNPILGNPLGFQSEPHYSLIFIIGYAILFSLNELLDKKTDTESGYLISSSFLNCAGSYGLIIIMTLTTFRDSIALYNSLTAVIFLAISAVFWIRFKSVFSTFFYSMLGFTALSVTIISEFSNPYFFILLGWQSLFVIMTAILFRSRFIIVANFAIYIIILITYLLFATEVDSMSLSFGIISLLSARILNWKKDGLNLKTELMRISYLITAFFIIPYSFYKLFPEGYVSLSWIGLTIFYYSMGIMLKNLKYRWMAILTLLMTIGYVLIVDLINLDPVFRIISFLALGIVLISISIIYNRKNKPLENKENMNKG